MTSKLSKHFCLTFGDPRSIYSEKVKLFDFSTLSAFAVLQSVAHTEWALVWGSTTGETPAYVGTSCFDTFPFPPSFVVDGSLSHEVIDSRLETVGKAYFEYRTSICESRQQGFTAVYNLVHSRDETTEDVIRFRQLIAELDRAVVATYGWHDIQLNHQFVETKRGVRFGVDSSSRLEILKRLTELNHERFEASTRSSGASSAAAKSKRGRRAKAAPLSALDGLFDEDGQ